MRRAILLCLLACCPVAWADDLPGDVTHQIGRQKACNYWMTERPDNSFRKDQIAHHLRELNCEALPHDEAVLRARYRGNAAVQDALDQAQNAFPDG